MINKQEYLQEKLETQARNGDFDETAEDKMKTDAYIEQDNPNEELTEDEKREAELTEQEMIELEKQAFRGDKLSTDCPKCGQPLPHGHCTKCGEPVQGYDDGLCLQCV